MPHESKVLKIVPAELQPPKEIKCRDCIHGDWHYFKNRESVDPTKMMEVEVHCMKYYQKKYSSSGNECSIEMHECDGHSNEVKDSED